MDTKNLPALGGEQAATRDLAQEFAVSETALRTAARMPPSCLVVLVAVGLLGGGGDAVELSQARIALLAGLSLRTVRASLARLRTAGLLEVAATGHEAARRGSALVYRLVDFGGAGGDR